MRLPAASDLVSGVDGSRGTDCVPQTLAAFSGWASAGADFNEPLRCSLKILVGFPGPIGAKIIKIWPSAGLRAALPSPSFIPSSEKQR